MLAFTKTLLDHIAEPAHTTFQHVNAAHSKALDERESLSAKELAAAETYDQTVEGPRNTVMELYEEYKHNLQKAGPVSKYEKPQDLTDKYIQLSNRDLYSCIPFYH